VVRRPDGVVFFVLMLGGAINLATGGGQLFRKMNRLPRRRHLHPGRPLGLVRALSLMRRGWYRASLRDALGAFFIWQSTGLTVARASVQACSRARPAFLRTPKVAERASVWRAFAANWAETALGILGVAAIVASLTRFDTASGPLLAVLLVVPTAGFLAAPVNSLAAQRADCRRNCVRAGSLNGGAMDAPLVGGSNGFSPVPARSLAAIVALFGLLVAPSPHFTPAASHGAGASAPTRHAGPVPVRESIAVVANRQEPPRRHRRSRRPARPEQRRRRAHRPRRHQALRTSRIHRGS